MHRKVVTKCNNFICQRQNYYDDEYDKDKTYATPSVVVTPNTPGASNQNYAPGNEVNTKSPARAASVGSSFRNKHHTPNTADNWAVKMNEEPGLRNQDQEEQEMAEMDQNGQTKNPMNKKNGIDVSLYTTKKNVAQGMLDIALLSANCSQLKYLLFHYERDVNSLVSGSGSAPADGSGSWLMSMDFYFIVNLVCIALSIGLQVIVGVLLIMNSRHNIYIHRYQKVADSYSNSILMIVFIITIVNIFLSVFISAR